MPPVQAPNRNDPLITLKRMAPCRRQEPWNENITKTDTSQDRPPAAIPDREQLLLDFAVSQSRAVFYIAELENDLPVRFISNNIEAITGHKPASFVDEHAYGRRFIHPDDLDDYFESLRRLPEAGALTHTYRFSTADGAWMWFRDELRMMPASDDAPAQFVGCMIDISSEVETQLALSRSEAMNQAIVATSRNGIVTVNGQGELIAMNPAAERLFGYAEAEIVGRQIGDVLIPPHLRQRHEDGFTRYRKTGVSQMQGRVMETEAMRSNGSCFPVELAFSQISVDGEVRFVADIRDLSERLEARQQRENLLQLLQDAMNSLPHGFSVSDADGKLLLCNDAFAEAYGRAPADLIGHMSRDFVEEMIPGIASINGQQLIADKVDLDDVMARLDRASTAPIELHLKTGEWWLITRHPTSDGGIASLRTDITALKAAEAAVRESNALVYRLLEACPVPFGMTRAEDSLILYESPASKALFQRGSDMEAAFGIDNFADPEDRVRYMDALRRDGAVDNFDLTFKRTDGSRFPGQLSARLIEFDGEEVIVFSSADLTRQHEIEAEMEMQREALHQTEKLSALGELLAGIAHELNNPLSVLVGQALLLRETAEDPTVKLRAERIGNAADRCARIVKTFLAMARQEPAKARDINLRDIVDAALEFTGYALRGANIKVHVRMARELPAIHADAAQLQQVLVNLIVNAQHALDERDRDDKRELKIITSYRERDQEVVLKIKDNGPGMPEHVRRRIFEPLFTTKDVGTGTGIGLALCHRIIKSHGGKMKVESKEGQGTAFVIRFPVSTTAPSAEEAVDKPAKVKASGRALVIDDEPDVGELIGEILKREGFAVDLAHSGADALDRLKGGGYDVILSDLKMPGFNGHDLFQELTDHSVDLVGKLAFITGDTMSAKAREFLESTGRPYLEKPISPKDVRRLLAKMADSGPT